MGKPKKKSVKPVKKRGMVKGVLFMIVAMFFFGYMILYAGGDIKGFFALIIALVCSLLGIMYLWGSRGRAKKKQGKRAK